MEACGSPCGWRLFCRVLQRLSGGRGRNNSGAGFVGTTAGKGGWRAVGVRQRPVRDASLVDIYADALRTNGCQPVGAERRDLGSLFAGGDSRGSAWRNTAWQSQGQLSRQTFRAFDAYLGNFDDSEVAMGFFIALIIAALSGMGVGGGGLFALYLKYFSSHSQIEIQAINLTFFLFASGAALSIHLLRRRIYPIPVVIMMIFGLLGSLVGSSLALRIEGDILGRIFGGMMIAAGIYSLIPKNAKK